MHDWVPCSGDVRVKIKICMKEHVTTIPTASMGLNEYSKQYGFRKVTSLPENFYVILAHIRSLLRL